MKKGTNLYIKVLSVFTVLLFSLLFANAQTKDTLLFTDVEWVAPANVTTITVECWGAGGGGGAGAKDLGGGGAGGGAYSITENVSVTPNDPYVVQIGVGGAGGTKSTAAGNGTATFFIDLNISANGGDGGLNATGAPGAAPGDGGLGGAAGGGNPTYSGGAGSNGSGAASDGGGGGSSADSLSNGNTGSITAGGFAVSGEGAGGNGGSGANGSIGQYPGGGGGAGGGNNTDGGAGAHGRMIITYTVAEPNNCPNSTGIAPIEVQNKCVGDGGNILTASIGTTGGSGTPTLLYEWYYNDAVDSNNPAHASATQIGVTTDTYTPPTTAAEVGTRYYFCVGYATDNSCGQSNTDQTLASNTVQVNVSLVPDTPTAILGPASPIEGTSGLTYSTTSSNADANGYAWTVPASTAWSITAGATSNEITVTAGAFGENGNITVTASNNGCVSAQTTLAVAPAAAGGPLCPSSNTANPGAPTSTCSGGAPLGQLSVAVATESGSTGSYNEMYQWYYNTTNTNTVSGATKIGGATSANYTPPNSPSDTLYYFCVLYTTDNTCGQTDATQSLASNTIEIIVDTIPDPIISGLTSVNPSTTGYVYSIEPVAGVTNYNWAWPAGWTYESGQDTPTLTITSGAIGEDGNITVTATNACGTTDPASFLPITITSVTNHSTVSCASCHTFHDAGGPALTSGANATLCISCHNPTAGSMAINKPFLDSDKAVPGTSSGNSHAWNVPAVNATYETNLPSNNEMLIRLNAGDSIVCSTCHDQHNSAAAPPYLRINNDNDAMCKDCHSARNVDLFVNGGKGSHPIGNNVTYDDTDTRFENTQSLIANGDTVNCSTCHGVHDVTGSIGITTDGNLLRMDNTADALCLDCHKPMFHNGMICSDCHDVHNHTDKNNIYMIRDSVNGNDVSFTSLTDFDYLNLPTSNGICNTCHDDLATPLKYHRADGTGASHNDGQNCTSCHTHESSFAASCINCHSTAQDDGDSNPVGGRRAVVGEFSKNTHHIGAAITDADCEVCHDQTNHQAGTVLLKDPDGGASYSYDPAAPNDIDNFCKNCHDADGATYTGGGGTTPFSDLLTVPDATAYGRHNTRGCHQCHAAHGSTNIRLVNEIIDTRPVVFTALTGPNSFADDGNAPYDGVCEVCHTNNTKGYHYFDGSGPGGSHNEGQNCTTCHTHDTQFAPGGSCVDCHNTLIAPDARSGAPQIVGTGGHFDIAAQTSTHVGGSTPAEPTKENCESCHYTASHPTNAMALRDVDATDTEWATNNEAYCIQCHDGGMPTNIVDYSAFSTAQYNKSNFTTTTNKHDDTATNSCANCHDKHGSANSSLLTIAGTNEVFCGSCHTSGQSAATFDISGWSSGTNSHAWAVNATNATYDAVPPTDPTMSGRLDGTNIVCATCHNVHDNTNSRNLTATNSADQMCKDCHGARNQSNYAGGGIGSHPVGVTYTAGGNYVDPAPTLTDNQVGLVGGNIECSSCHDVHNSATSDGNLLREDMVASSATCKECHNYQDHFGGMTCLDCHEAHNTGNTNIYLIKDIITTPNSGDQAVVFTGDATFSDGDGTYNGVCEVCHTSTAHHTNTDDGHSHNDGADCTGCHSHGDATNSFPNSTCHGCHDSSSPYLYPLASEGYEEGSHAKHVGELEYTCNTCHNGYGSGGASEPSHSSGSTNISFSGLAVTGGASPTWDGTTCSNVYCHSDGQGAYATIPNWVGGTVACGDCHADDPDGNPVSAPTSNAHAKHTGTLYSFSCKTCHVNHINGSYEAINTFYNVAPWLDFDPNGLAFPFGADAGLTPTYNSGAKTCDNIYCHSDGRNADRGTDGIKPWSGVTGSQASNYPATTPAWDTGTITLCTSCHGGKGNMTSSPYTIDNDSPNTHLVLDYNDVGDAPSSGLHTHKGMFNDNDDCTTGPTGTGAVQCYLCHNTDGAACGATNYQGTYGSPKKLHVDGQTYFKLGLYGDGNGGTWAPYSTYLDHCTSKKNWE